MFPASKGDETHQGRVLLKHKCAARAKGVQESEPDSSPGVFANGKIPQRDIDLHLQSTYNPLTILLKSLSDR